MSMKLQSPWLRPLIGLFGVMSSSLLCAAALPDRQRAEPKIELYRPDQFGGVTRVFRYAVAQPDRSEIAYLFLTEPERPHAPPQEVQVVGKRGEMLRLSDTQGADCTLERVWIRTRDEGGPEIVHAQRTFSGDLDTDVESEPAVMEVQVFRPKPGEQPGDSAVRLVMTGAAVRSRPVCQARDVQGEMVRLATPSGGARR